MFIDVESIAYSSNITRSRCGSFACNRPPQTRTVSKPGRCFLQVGSLLRIGRIRSQRNATKEISVVQYPVYLTKLLASPSESTPNRRQKIKAKNNKANDSRRKLPVVLKWSPVCEGILTILKPNSMFALTAITFCAELRMLLVGRGYRQPKHARFRGLWLVINFLIQPALYPQSGFWLCSHRDNSPPIYRTPPRSARRPAKARSQVLASQKNLIPGKRRNLMLIGHFGQSALCEILRQCQPRNSPSESALP